MNSRTDNPASRFAEEVRELRAILDGIDEKTDILSHLWEGETADLARGRYNRIKSELDAGTAKLLILGEAPGKQPGEERNAKENPDGDTVFLSDFIL